MRKNKILIFGIAFVFAIFLSLQCSAYIKSSIQYVSPGLIPGFSSSSGGEWVPDRTMCEAGQDFAVQIEPFGCTPAVVRSDLLEEQNAPVFCQLSAIKMNPFLTIEAIDSITFAGKQLPNSISGVGFYPAQAALGVPNKLNSPVLNNIGYAVIVLKKQPNESAMPDVVSGNLTATLKYNIKEAYGIGDTRFYLPEITDDKVWESSMKQYGFWNQKGYLRAEAVTANEAKLSVYTDKGKLRTVSLNKGETSTDVYLPGFDCFVGVKLKLDDLVSPDTRAVLTVNGDTIQLNKGENFLENKCTFINWEKRGLTKKAEISCKADEGTERFELVLTPRVSLNIGGDTKLYAVGDFLYEGMQEGKKVYVYLGYAGTKGDSEKLDDLYVTLVSSAVSSGAKLSDSAISTYASRAEGIYSNVYRDKSVILRVIAEAVRGAKSSVASLYDRLSENKDLKYIQYKPDAIWMSSELKDKSDNNFAGKEVKVVDFASPVNFALKEGGASSDYYKSASQDYSKVVSSFAAEKDPLSAEVILGEESFIQNIKLAGFLNQKSDVEKLCKDFKSAYKSSSRYDSDSEVKSLCENPSKKSSATSSSKEVTINAKQKIISLEDIKSPTFEEYGARVKITLPDGSIQSLDLIKDKINYFGSGSSQYIQLISIDKDTVSLNVNTTRAGVIGQIRSNAETLKKGAPNSFGTAYVFEVTDIYEKKNAKVSILATVNRAQTEANFSFFIGIEKRAIKLSPEKTKERIEDLNATIKQWGDVNKKLTTLVEGMKGACLATGLALTMKNFIENVDGKSIARQEVMNGEGGWNKKCIDAVTTKKLDGKVVTYKTVEECFVGEANKIDSQVNSLLGVIQTQDAEIKKLQDNCKLKSEGLFFEEVIDTDCLRKAYSVQMSSELKSSLSGYTFKYNNQDVPSSEILTLIDKNKVSIEDMRTIQLYARARSSDQLSDTSKKELDKVFADIYSSNQQELATLKSAETEGVSADKIPHLSTGKDAAKTVSYSGLKYSDIATKRSICSLSKICEEGGEGFCYTDCDRINITANTPVQYFTMDNGKTYVATLDKQGTKFFIKNLYDVGAGRFLDDKERESIASKFNFQIMNEESYKGRGYKSSAGSSVLGPVLRCYETEPYKGYPAVAPVNTKDGWYVSISQNLPVSGNIGSYDASGRITSFWICNVWENGIEENKGGDDKCTLINLGTGQALQIGGLSASESSKLVDEARKVVEAGQKACKTGKAGDVITLGTNAKGIKMGTPAANIPDLSCYNFMSPADCKILFNVCDPVVCPSSRCNFGGKYPVRDVIQSGIIGSLVLCLPNFAGFGGDVYIPVCLSGLKAGLDGLLSVFEAYRDCLQESLNTGQMVGICDEIYSVHLCEFFWRQTLPLANMIIPKTIELIMGQSVRGGGEYLSVQNAWTTAGQSMDYFAQYYAAESYAAFKARISQEVTDAVCKTYISGAYPDGGKIIDTLTKADSPSQFTGRFDEIPYTTATNPPISQYKVFYHIYAGNDSRVYYQVYLTDAGESSYYQDTSVNIVVDTGYIAQGGKITQTKDFTAVSGYKKMCITINGNTECGFKQVSTSFALDYVADQYVNEQANATGITSQSTCVSGTPSVWSLASVNPEGAAAELVSPQLYNRGIIRICANENPGLSTDKDSTTPRWVSVGYCGKKEVKCWLDTQSVKDAVNFDSTAQEVLASTTKTFLDQMIADGKYLSDSQFTLAVSEIGKQEAASRISTINSIMDKVLMNSQKGKLYLLRAMAYNELASSGFTTEKIEADRVAAEEAKKIEDTQKEAEKEAQKETNIIASLEKPCGKDYVDAETNSYFTMIQQLSKRTDLEKSTYYSNAWNREFVETIYANGNVEEALISSYEYNLIIGNGFQAKAQTMKSVFDLLYTKYSALCTKVGVSMPSSNCFSADKAKAKAYLEEINFFKEVNSAVKYSEVPNIQSRIDSLPGKELISDDELKSIKGMSTRILNIVGLSSPFGLGEKTVGDVYALLNAKYTELCNPTTVSTDSTTEAVASCGEGWAVDSSGLCAVNGEEGRQKISVKVKGDYLPIVQEASAKYGVDENLIKAVITQESAWNPNAQSRKECYGLMQLGGTAGAVGDITNKEKGNCYALCNGDYKDDWKTNPRTNILLGTCYLKCLKDKYLLDGNLRIAAYNAGPTIVNKNCKNQVYDSCKSKLPKETQNYVTKVLGYYASYASNEREFVVVPDSIAVPAARVSIGKVLANYSSSSKLPFITITSFKNENALELKIQNPSCDYVAYGIGSQTFGLLILSYDSSGDIKTKTSGGIFSRTISMNDFTPSKEYYAKVWCYDKNKKEVGNLIELGPFVIPVNPSAEVKLTCDSKKESYLNAITEVRNLDSASTYTQNVKNWEFVDKIYTQEIITTEEYRKLTGEGAYITEKPMRDVFSLLKTKYTQLCGEPYATLGYVSASKSLLLGVKNDFCNSVNYTIYTSGFFKDSVQLDGRGKPVQGVIAEFNGIIFVGNIPLSVFPNSGLSNEKYYANVQCSDFDANPSYNPLMKSAIFEASGDEKEISITPLTPPAPSEPNYATLQYQLETKTLRLNVVGPSCSYVTYKLFPSNLGNEPYTSERAGDLSQKQGTLFVKTFSPFLILDRVYYAEVYCYDSNKKQVGDLINSNNLEFDSSQITTVGGA